MVKDYSVQGTTKLQREKYVRDAIALSTLDAPEPSEETMRLMNDYIEGAREISEVLMLTILRYKVDSDNA
ncbi:MAG: antitoxin VbhA family protein [Oscillospiraceae bacterium]|nr:antitoxin VbhA family protein [Oscillospiraceae bacterium]